MKGLQRLPNSADLDLAYLNLQRSEPLVPIEKLAIYCQWSRLDPRLAEIWATFVSNYWTTISAVEFNQILLLQPWPAAAGVLLDGVETWFSPNPRNLFQKWKDCVLHAIEPQSEFVQFFLGHRSFASRLMLEDAQLALAPYRNWGFFGREVLRNKVRSQGQTLLSAEQRRVRMNELIRKHQRITVQLYVEALDSHVGLRQAELDLQNHPKLMAIGNTRARFYRIKQKR